MKKLGLIALTATLFSAYSHANQIDFTQSQIDSEASTMVTQDLQEYFSIREISVTEIADGNDTKQDTANLTPKDINDVVMTLDKIIAVGKKIWAIVDAGRPVVSTNMGNSISVIPNPKDGFTAFSEMENWNIPSAKSYRVSYKNGFGSEVVSFTYTVYYQDGGTWEGKGKYLTGVNITASNVKVKWGFDFNAESQLMAISNHGTKEDPEAGATLQVSYTVKNWLNHISATETIHILGRGLVKVVK